MVGQRFEDASQALAFSRSYTCSPQKPTMTFSWSATCLLSAAFSSSRLLISLVSTLSATSPRGCRTSTGGRLRGGAPADGADMGGTAGRCWSWYGSGECDGIATNAGAGRGGVIGSNCRRPFKSSEKMTPSCTAAHKSPRSSNGTGRDARWDLPFVSSGGGPPRACMLLQCRCLHPHNGQNPQATPPPPPPPSPPPSPILIVQRAKEQLHLVHGHCDRHHLVCRCIVRIFLLLGFAVVRLEPPAAPQLGTL